MIGFLFIFVVLVLAFAALADDYDRPCTALGPRRYTVKNAVILYKGALCCGDGNGEALPGTDAANLVFLGVNRYKRVDNTNDGEICELDKFTCFEADGTGFAAGDVGKRLYILTDTTVGLEAASTHHVYCGRMKRFISSTRVEVDPLWGDDDIDIPSEVVAAPASATSTNGAFTSIASAIVAAASVSATTASAIASASFSATPTSAELAAFAALVAPLATDMRTVASAVVANASVQSAALTEAEKSADDGRAALSKAGGIVTALTAQGLFTAS